MSIAYKDFSRIKDKGLFGFGATEMSLHEAVANANRWIAESGVDVINVETLIATDRYTNQADVDGVAIRLWYKILEN